MYIPDLPQSSVMGKEQQKMPLCSTPDVSLTHGPVVTHLQPIDVPLDRPPPPKRRKSNQSVPKSQNVTSVSHVYGMYNYNCPDINFVIRHGQLICIDPTRKTFAM